MSSLGANYAKALLRLEAKPHVVEYILQLLVPIGNSPDAIRQLASHPDPAKTIVSMIETACKEQKATSPDATLLYRLTTVLHKAKRLTAIEDIANAYQQLLAQQSGAIQGQVEFAVESDKKSLLEQLQTLASSLSGKTVSLTPKIKPEIVGGFLIRIDNLVVDATLASKLRRFKSS